MGTIICFDGTKKEIEPANGKHFELAELQKIVGGDIEIVALPEGDGIMIVNEEGKLLNLPYNASATEIYRSGEDFIVGNVLICPTDQVE